MKNNKPAFAKCFCLFLAIAPFFSLYSVSKLTLSGMKKYDNAPEQAASSITVDLSYLLLRARNEGLAYAFQGNLVYSPGADANLIRTGNTIRPGRIWSSGSRVTIGWNQNITDWNSLATWTYYQNTTKNNYSYPPIQGSIVNTIDEGLYSYWTVDYSTASTPVGNVGGFLELHADWRVVYNMISWDLGKVFYVSGNIQLRPKIGVKSGWIHQYFDNELKRPARTGSIKRQQVICHNNFWGIGLSSGIDSNFQIGAGFFISGEFNLSLLSGRTNTRRILNLDTPGLELLRAENWTDRVQQIAPGTELTLGLGWLKQIDSQKQISISLSWEEIFWWNQFDFMNYDIGSSRPDSPDRLSNIPAYPTKGKGLNIEGAALKAQFTF